MIVKLVAKNVNTSALLTGRFDTIAVRVTSQPDVVALCKATNKPIVSTSANLSGQAPAKTWQDIPNTLAEKIDYIESVNSFVVLTTNSRCSSLSPG